MHGASPLLNLLNGPAAGIGSTPAARGPAANAGPAPGTGGFSNMLQQAREQNTRQAERPRTEPRPPQAAAQPMRPPAAMPTPAPSEPAAPSAPPANNNAAPATPEAEHPAERDEAREATEAQAAGPADLAGLPWAPLMSDTADATTPQAALEDAGTLEGIDAELRRGLPGPGRAGEERPGLEGRGERGTEPQQAAFDEQLEAQLAATEAETPRGAEPAGPMSSHEPAAGLMPAGAAQASAPATTSLAGGETQGSVAVPVDSPEFPEALASQITYLVRDGVQQAKLMLNPLDMGPLTVQIALQGQQAQVDFTAANASTRAALEASLAELAAALQGAGFTLTGGGVSQHSSQGQAGAGGREAAPGSDAQSRVAEPDGAPVVPAVRRLRQGALDLFA